MTYHFEIGDRVRLSGKDTYIERWPHIYAEATKEGKITRVGSTYNTDGEWWLVEWDKDAEHFGYHYPSEDLLPLSVIYSEDYLKDKDVL